ncbi:hypothetical protein [Cytobacillus massiliigabonensis]|uniref:hypothetical protein n=1 Tax=Cytobacillus massiliigabonensis TaxID=1871011 RepID=UPI001F269363|nr:hypothetical protein [Cytobacillus massiliigabonensis]
MYSKERLERKIARIKDKIKSLKAEHGDTPSLTHTYHGGWDLGYWQGRLSILEEFLDDMEEN